MVAAAVAKVVAEMEPAIAKAVAEAVVPLRAALEEAKVRIAALLQELHGTKSERSQVVLTAEGQQFIDATWLNGTTTEQAPGPLSPVPVTTVRKPRDPRGVAQRHPHLPIQESTPSVPAELQEQIDAGTIRLERTGKYQDALVVEPTKPFISRVHEMAVVRVATAATAMLLPMPPRIVEGGVLADASIHQVVIAKFLDAMPFHRTLAAWARLKLDVSRQVINDAFAAWSGIFEPLADAIIDRVLDSDVVHADDAWARVQAPGTCKTGHIWTVLGGGQVGYRYTPDWTHARAGELIPKDFKGYLVRDEWPGWKTLDAIRQAGCNAHARRPFAKFLDREPGSQDAQVIVRLYAELYAIEHEANAGPPDQILRRRAELRRTRSSVIMVKIRAEAERIATAYHAKHPLADGARYIIDYFPLLTKFLGDPLLPPDNNAAEGALRINALIRKNSMFFGSDDGGERAAVALTVLHSCRMAGVEPFAYLMDVTPTLITHANGRKQDLTKLIPANWKASRQDTRT